jgi:hypothetical protein
VSDWNSKPNSTVVNAPMRLVRYEQKIRYGTKEIPGLLPIGYFSLIRSKFMATFPVLGMSV